MWCKLGAKIPSLYLSAQIKGALEGWDILGKPDNPVPLFTTWRDLLRETDSSSTTVPSTDRWLMCEHGGIKPSLFLCACIFLWVVPCIFRRGDRGRWGWCREGLICPHWKCKMCGYKLPQWEAFILAVFMNHVCVRCLYTSVMVRVDMRQIGDT